MSLYNFAAAWCNFSMKNFMARLFLLLACALLISCGSGSPANTPSKYKKDDPEKAPPQPQEPCPTSQPSNLHRITLNLARPMPAKIGLKLDGDKEYRLSECSEPSLPGVKASWRRNSPTQLEITVEHGSFFNNSLPDGQGLEVHDLKGCTISTPEIVFKSPAPIKLSWRTENPLSHCPHSRAAGTAINLAL